MPVVSTRIMPDGIVRFRVNSFEPNPLPAPLSRPGEWLMAVHLDMPETRAHINFPLMPAEFQPHLDAIREAIQSQNVYWVDNNPDPAWNPGMPINSVDRRILQALANHQVIDQED